MSHALGMPAAVVMSGAGAWAGYLVARRIGGAVPPSVRLAGALIVWQCLAVVVFSLLATASLFRLPVALAVWLGLAGALHRWLDGAGAWGAARADLRAVTSVAQEYWSSWPRRLLLVAAVVAVGTRLTIGLSAPPVAWDTMTYHAFKAARWVQEGGWFVDRADRPPAFILHLIKRDHAGAWPLWRALDDSARHRIAVTAGWDGVGHNVMRYPFLGSRLQNQVVYVPITRDGAIIDYERADEVRRNADADAWLSRLRAAAIDTVVVLGKLGATRGITRKRGLAQRRSYPVWSRGSKTRRIIRKQCALPLRFCQATGSVPR